MKVLQLFDCRDYVVSKPLCYPSGAYGEGEMLFTGCGVVPNVAAGSWVVPGTPIELNFNDDDTHYRAVVVAVTPAEVEIGANIFYAGARKVKGPVVPRSRGPGYLRTPEVSQEDWNNE